MSSAKFGSPSAKSQGWPQGTLEKKEEKMIQDDVVKVKKSTTWAGTDLEVQGCVFLLDTHGAPEFTPANGRPWPRSSLGH